MDAYSPLRAYKNLEFLNSPAARTIRILCEYEETRQRLRREGVEHTVVFFGSARIRSPEAIAERLSAARLRVDAAPDDRAALAELHAAQGLQRLGPYYQAARELARRITEWTMDRPAGRRYFVASGGGPGIMEAANRGAAEVPGGRSVGFGISLPFEPGVNGWIDHRLAFEFHYFFVRKFWFMYPSEALVVFPGGFGTMDELFESITLMQTGKVERLPVVLFGTEYWDRVVDLQAMVEFGTISADDLLLLHRTDSVDDAFAHLTSHLLATERCEHADQG